MSFSFSVSGKGNVEVRDAVRAKMAEIVTQQPNHKYDEQAVYEVLDVYLELMPVLDDHTIHASVSGSLSWNIVDNEPIYNGASISVSVRAVQS